MHRVYLTQNTNRVHVTGTPSPGSVVNVCKTANSVSEGVVNCGCTA